MGHLNLAMGNYKRAVEDYKKSITLDNNNMSNFIKAVNADTQYFEKMGIDTLILPFIIDAVQYSLTD